MQKTNVVSTYSVKGSNARQTLEATVSVSVKYKSKERADLEPNGCSKQKDRMGLATYIQPDILITSTDLFDNIPEPESITCDGKECIRLEYPTSLRQLLSYTRISYLRLTDPSTPCLDHARIVPLFPLLNQVSLPVSAHHLHRFNSLLIRSQSGMLKILMPIWPPDVFRCR